MTTIVIIPARGGSKRIPRKNVRDFCGKPMLAWTIEAARSSGCFDEIMVSTDDQGIANVAQKWGVETPFIRPAHLADDITGTVPVINHAVEWYKQRRELPAVVCCLYATAPFLLPADIQRGLAILEQSGADYAISVTSFPFPIQRALRITRSKRVEMFNPEHLSTRSQDLESAYHDAGQFYWGTSEAWLSGKPLLSNAAAAVEIPRYRVQDIDTQEDWERAEWLFKALQVGEGRIR